MEDATEEGTPGEGSVSRLIVVPRIRPDPSQAGFVKGQLASSARCGGEQKVLQLIPDDPWSTLVSMWRGW